MEKKGWKYVLGSLLLVLLAVSLLLYIQGLKTGVSMKGATLVYEEDFGMERVAKTG